MPAAEWRHVIRAASGRAMQPQDERIFLRRIVTGRDEEAILHRFAAGTAVRPSFESFHCRRRRFVLGKSKRRHREQKDEKETFETRHRFSESKYARCPEF